MGMSIFECVVSSCYIHRVAQSSLGDGWPWIVGGRDLLAFGCSASSECVRFNGKSEVAQRAVGGYKCSTHAVVSLVLVSNDELSMPTQTSLRISRASTLAGEPFVDLAVSGTCLATGSIRSSPIMRTPGGEKARDMYFPATGKLQYWKAATKLLGMQ
eukprot:6492384-Amphidinium_carterae.7